MENMIAQRTPINTWIKDRVPEYNEEVHRNLYPDIIEEDFWEILRDVWEYTCVTVPGLYNIYNTCSYIVEKNIPGDVLECGVFFGGSVMFAAHVLERNGGLKDRELIGLDTFSGFVSRTEHDVDFNGADVCHPCPTEYSFFEQALGNVRSVECDQSKVNLVQGDVFKELNPTIEGRKIAMLRLDTDTYDTTKFELEEAWDNVSKGGVVILDDYGWCKGARKATDDFIKDKSVFLSRVNNWTRCFVKI